jgi:hypothetical protein
LFELRLPSIDKDELGLNGAIVIGILEQKFTPEDRAVLVLVEPGAPIS